MARPSTDYEPRSPAHGALHQIVRDHFETFRMQAATMRDGEGLPRFVEQAFRKFLQCGCLAGGVARGPMLVPCVSTPRLSPRRWTERRCWGPGRRGSRAGSSVGDSDPATARSM